MKFTLIFCIALLSVVVSAFATNKGTYGPDNRINIYESADIWQEKARSVAVLIPNDKVVSLFDELILQANNHSSVNRVCSDERFASEPAPADCSGVLVASDLILTASHCLRFNSIIKNYRWVFDYGFFSEGQSLKRVSANNSYRPVEVVERKVDINSGLEYLLVRLDRPVEDRSPLEFREFGSISLGEPVVVIGSPSGLPLKVAGGAYVRKIKNQVYFVTNTDTFGGNSGSPVFNEITGIVEGILVRGDNDYSWSEEEGCYRVINCEMNDCKGEDVVTTPNIQYFK